MKRSDALTKKLSAIGSSLTDEQRAVLEKEIAKAKEERN